MRWLADGTDRTTCSDVLAVAYGMTQWDTQTHMLANVFDALAVISWQLGGEGKPPEPIARPGSKTPEPVSSAGEAVEGNPFNPDESGVFKGEPMPIDELNSWLGWVTRDDLIFDAYQQGGRTYADIAEEFGVSASTVGRIVRKMRAKS